VTAGNLIDVNRDDVMRDQVADVIEPERRQLREDLAFVGDARTEDVVERRDAIGGDDEQMAAEIIDVAHLAATSERQSIQIGFENDGIRHSDPRKTRKPITCA
jgi:hypothetical protein